MVVGDFKEGKSSLVNALVNADVCPVDDHETAAYPTVVTYSEEPFTRWAQRRADGQLQHEDVEADELVRRVTARRVDGSSIGGANASIGIPRALLNGGLELVDWPGVGGLESQYGAAALATLCHADAFVFVTDASQELTGAELDFLRRAVERCPTAAIALTKCDLCPNWQRIAEIDAQHLIDVRLTIPVHPVSARLRMIAFGAGDRALNAESGIASMVHWLRQLTVNQHVLGARTSGRELVHVTRLLIEPFEAEHSALSDPGASEELVNKLETARAAYERLRSEGARWRQQLADGMADLTADIEFDLKQRLRTVMRDAEAGIGDADPAEYWDAFEPWLYTRVADEVAANHQGLVERSSALLADVEAEFDDEDPHAIDRLELELDPKAMDRLDVTAAPDLEHPSRATTSMSAMRGVQSGMLMLTMTGGILGLTVAAPVVIGIGLAMGRHGLHEERRRQLLARRQHATASVRTYIDEALFKVGKEGRDFLRITQRAIRDALGDRASELERSAVAAVEVARSAIAADERDRKARVSKVDAELARLRPILERAARIASLRPQ